MSGRAVQPYVGSDGKSMSPNQSMWMAHWMQTRCSSSTQVRNFSSLQHEVKEDHNDTRQHLLLGRLERAFTILESTEQFEQLSDDRAADIMTKCLKTSSEISTSKRLNCQPFPIFSLSRNREVMSASETDQTAFYQRQGKCRTDHDSVNDTIDLGGHECCFPSVLEWSPAKTKVLSGDCQLQFEGTSKNREQQVLVKPHAFFKKKYDFSRPFQDDFTRSASKIVLYKCNRVRTPMQSLMFRQELNQSSSVVASKECFINDDIVDLQHENCNYRRYSEFVVREERDNCLNLRKAGKSLDKDDNRTTLLHDASLSGRFPVFIGGELQKMHGFSNVGFLPSESSPSKFSQANHRFLIEKNTDVNLCERGQTFSGSSAKVKGNLLCKFLSLSPDFDSHKQWNLRPQSIGSFKDNERNGNVENVKSKAPSINRRDESSAETDIMDFSAFQDKDHCSGEASSASCKDHTGGQLAPTLQSPLDLAKEVIDSVLNKYVLDINQVPPAGPSSIYERGSSPSTTQSLDVEHLLSHTEQPVSSKLSPCSVSTKESEPSSRWVKRLKLSPADSLGHGTKSSKIGEVLFPEKVNKFFGKIIKGSRTDSDSAIGKCYGKEPMVLGQTAACLRVGESSLMELKKKDRDMTLSHSWIQRLCKDRFPLLQKQHGAAMIRDPQRSKMVDDFPEKRYPSIAAMALMGKAISDFRPCEFKNRGAFVVWDIEGVLS